jgi:tripartite ATP-independent transporter DctM subunit
MGGMVPGVIMAIFLMGYVAFVAKRRGYQRGEIYAFRQFIKNTVIAFPALLTPVILLGGIYTGVVTPTEAGALAGTWALLIAFFVYRVMGFKQLIDILVDTVKATGTVAIIVGAAYSFSYIVAIEHIPDMFANLLLNITENKYILLLIVNILFLVLGMFIDTMAITLVFIPMVLPLVELLGIDLVHFGVLIVLNMMIGLTTPPFGVLLFIVSGISKTPLKDVIRECLPMTIVLIIVLFIVTYIPEVVLFVPNFLGQ